MGTIWTATRQAAGNFGAISHREALDVARAFATDESPRMVEFRLQIGRAIRDYRAWQAQVARRQPGTTSLFGMLDLPPEPPDVATTLGMAVRVAGLHALAYAEMRRAASALLATIWESTPGEFPEEAALLEAFGVNMTSTMRDERQTDIYALAEGVVTPPEDDGRVVIIEQTHDTIRWKLVDLYVVAVRTGQVERREGIPVPKRNDKDDRIRWYVPALATEITDQDNGKGYVAFVELEDTIDYLEGWTNEQRKRITAAYKWMGVQAGRERERERRMG